MVEEIFRAWYPQEYFKRIPAMPVVTNEASSSSSPMALPAHREKEMGKEEKLFLVPLIFETSDPMFHYVVAEDEAIDEIVAEMETEADSELEEYDHYESRNSRTKREASSMEYMVLHEPKNPFCEYYLRGRMLKRYAKRAKPEPQDLEVPYEQAKEFGNILEADHMFPRHDNSGFSGEKTTLMIKNHFSGVVMVFPQADRSEENTYLSLKAFAGHRLNGVTSVIFKSDSAEELVRAGKRMCWLTAPFFARSWPHNTSSEWEIRTLKELCRASHLQAGFNSKLWPVSISYTVMARSAFSKNLIAVHKRDSEIAGQDPLGGSNWRTLWWSSLSSWCTLFLSLTRTPRRHNRLSN